VVGRQNADIADILHLRDVAMATNFETKIAIAGFLCAIATRRLVMEGVGVWFLGLSICLLACLNNHMSKLHEIFCTYYLCGRGSVLL